jgi:LysR family transcriptional regulator, regulator for genes of the gallate degradation pathway
VLPAAVTAFMRRHPQVHVAIIEGSRGELVEPLRNGVIDLMVGALRDPLSEPDLEHQALFRDLPAVVARKDHPLAGSNPDLAALAAYSWIIAAPGAPLRASWEQMFTRAGLALPPVPIESGSVITIRQLLIDSDLLTLLSPDLVATSTEPLERKIIAPA